MIFRPGDRVVVVFTEWPPTPLQIGDRAEGTVVMMTSSGNMVIVKIDGVQGWGIDNEEKNGYWGCKVRDVSPTPPVYKGRRHGPLKESTKWIPSIGDRVLVVFRFGKVIPKEAVYGRMYFGYLRRIRPDGSEYLVQFDENVGGHDQGYIPRGHAWWVSPLDILRPGETYREPCRGDVIKLTDGSTVTVAHIQRNERVVKVEVSRSDWDSRRWGALHSTITRFHIATAPDPALLYKGRRMRPLTESTTHRDLSFDGLMTAAPEDLREYILALENVPQSPLWHPEGNVLRHVQVVTDRLARHGDVDLSLAGLLHDTGKDRTTEVDPETGRIGAFGHEHYSCQVVRIFSGWIREMGGHPSLVEYIVRYHMTPKYPQYVPPKRMERLKADPRWRYVELFNEADRGGTDI